MNHNANQCDAKTSARRRLLRGALAVPAVMTLSSGSALAESSALKCASKLPDGVAVGPLDNFFRVQRYALTVGTETRYLVNRGDINFVATAQGFSAGTYGTGDLWILVANGTGQDSWVGTNTPSPETGTFVALRFTNVGTSFTVTGLSEDSTPSSGTGKVMSGSCWSSFKP